MSASCKRKAELNGSEVEARTLDLVNRALTRRGFCPQRRMPTAIPSAPVACGVHRSLRDLGAAMQVFNKRILTDEATARYLASCWGTTAKPTSSSYCEVSWQVALPGELREFVRRFDALRFPHLVAKGRELRHLKSHA